MEVSTLTVLITTVSTAATAVIPLVAKFTAGRSEAVKLANQARQADLDLLKELLQKCMAEKLQLKKALLERGNHIPEPEETKPP